MYSSLHQHLACAYHLLVIICELIEIDAGSKIFPEDDDFLSVICGNAAYLLAIYIIDSKQGILFAALNGKNGFILHGIWIEAGFDFLSEFWNAIGCIWEVFP